MRDGVEKGRIGRDDSRRSRNSGESQPAVFSLTDKPIINEQVGTNLRRHIHQSCPLFLHNGSRSLARVVIREHDWHPIFYAETSWKEQRLVCNDEQQRQ